MKQSTTPFSTSPFSKVAKCWFILYLLVNLVWGLIPFYTKVIVFPFIALAIINIYAIIMIIKLKKQGVFTLASAEIVLVAYSLIRHQSIFYFMVNFILLCVTWALIRSKWEDMA